MKEKVEKGKKKKKKKKTPNSNKLKYGRSLPWASCIFNRRPDLRKKYCKDNFESIPSLRKNCETDFCSFCCEKNVPWIHKTHLFSCKKQCGILSKTAKNKKAKLDWKKLCINVSKPNFSVYAYCDDNFRGEFAQSVCKLDTCRLCCATTDVAKHTNITTRNLYKCFSLCAKKFVYNPKSEIEKAGFSPLKIPKIQKTSPKKNCC